MRPATSETRAGGVGDWKAGAISTRTVGAMCGFTHRKTRVEERATERLEVLREEGGRGRWEREERRGEETSRVGGEGEECRPRIREVPREPPPPRKERGEGREGGVALVVMTKCG